ncbi:hypothetical protein PHPALM_10328, partial [Phytophthora palmivora]
MPKKASTHGASAPSKSKTARWEPVTQSLALPIARRQAEPRFTYRDHSRGAESTDFGIPMITGSESEEDTTGSTKDPTPSLDAPSQNTPVDDSESSEAKAALTSSPAKNLTLDEGKARAQAAKAAFEKRADEGVAAAKKRAAPGSPF